MTNPENFTDFVFKLKENDEKTWKIFTEVIKRPLINWIIKNGVHDEEEIKIVCADSISTLLININNYTFDNYEKLRNCILTIALNKIRENRRNIKKFQLVDIQELSDNLSLIYLKSSYSLSDENIQKVLTFLLKSCNETEKTILIEHYYKGMKINEIARQLNISEENCRIIKFRALTMLRKKMTELKFNGVVDFEI